MPAPRWPWLRVALPSAAVLATFVGWWTAWHASGITRHAVGTIWHSLVIVLGITSAGFIAICLMRLWAGDRRGTRLALALWSIVFVACGIPTLLVLLAFGGGAVAVGAN